MLEWFCLETKSEAGRLRANHRALVFTGIIPLIRGRSCVWEPSHRWFVHVVHSIKGWRLQARNAEDWRIVWRRLLSFDTFAGLHHGAWNVKSWRHWIRLSFASLCRWRRWHRCVERTRSCRLRQIRNRQTSLHGEHYLIYNGFTRWFSTFFVLLQCQFFFSSIFSLYNFLYK